MRWEEARAFYRALTSRLADRRHAGTRTARHKYMVPDQRPPTAELLPCQVDHATLAHLCLVVGWVGSSPSDVSVWVWTQLGGWASRQNCTKKPGKFAGTVRSAAAAAASRGSPLNLRQKPPCAPPVSRSNCSARSPHSKVSVAVEGCCLRRRGEHAGAPCPTSCSLVLVVVLLVGLVVALLFLFVSARGSLHGSRVGTVQRVQLRRGAPRASVTSEARGQGGGEVRLWNGACEGGAGRGAGRGRARGRGEVKGRGEGARGRVGVRGWRRRLGERPRRRWASIRRTHQ